MNVDMLTGDAFSYHLLPGLRAARCCRDVRWCCLDFDGTIGACPSNVCGRDCGFDDTPENSATHIAQHQSNAFHSHPAKMAASRYCPSCLSAFSKPLTPPTRPSTAHLPSFLLPCHQIRTAVQSANAAKYKRKDQPTSQKKKKSKSTYGTADLRNALQFSLVDAMRYEQSLSTITPG